MKNLFLILFLLITFRSVANEINLVKKFLFDVKENSLQVKTYQLEGLSNEYTFSSNLKQFDTTGFLESNFSKQETPPLSPFVSQEQTRITYGAGISKLWESGFQTSLTYSLVDNETVFGPNISTPVFSFMSPTLELKVTSSIFRDLIGENYKNLKFKNNSGIEYSKYQSKTSQKEVLVNALFDFSRILEDRENVSLQNDLCKKIQKQSTKLSSKYKRKTVSKREYLQSQKELSLCRATVGNLTKNLDEKIDNFSAAYSFSVNEYLSLKSPELYNAIKKLYKEFSSGSKNIDIENISAVKLLSLEKKLHEFEFQELEAKARPDLAFEMRAGNVGVNDSFGNSQENLAELENPYVYAGVKLDLPFKNTAANSRAISKKYKLDSVKRRLELRKNQVLKRVETLFNSLEKDMKVLSEYTRALNISQSVYREAQKDFENGRLDFNDLIEFNKSLINDQKLLSLHRIEIVVRTVELLDYYQFFNEFITKESN